jgi:two-component system response regulator NreC
VRRLLAQEHVAELRRSGGDDPFERLTEREREVLQLVAEGNSNKEIAGRLFLSVLTVETHRKRVLEKLGLRGTPEAVLYAVSKGLIGPIR